MTEPTIEQLKQIAEWAYPQAIVHLGMDVLACEPSRKVFYGQTRFNPEDIAAQRLHLQDKYREWLAKEGNGFVALSEAFWIACESPETLIAAIIRDVLGGK